MDHVSYVQQQGHILMDPYLDLVFQLISMYLLFLVLLDIAFYLTKVKYVHVVILFFEILQDIM
jgi:hypothetical protein